MDPVSKLALPLLFVTTFILGIWSPIGYFSGTPKYWWDESFTVEIARTFLEIRKIDITVAPRSPSNIAVALNANGFPLSLPLAGFFSLFGIGVLQARVFMLMLLITAVFVIFSVLKKFFDRESAILGGILVATFASFYANGRTATGDIPGFILMLLGLFYILKKEFYFTGGILLGLAAVTKTSLYHMVFPAITLVFIFLYGKHFWKGTIKVASGSILIGALWLLLLLPRPYNLADIYPAVDFYRNPINKPSLLDRFPASLTEILSQSTIIYFLILAGIIVLAYFKSREDDEAKRGFFLFAFFYALFQLVVFLRSPGWNRYLLGIELLTLILLYPALKNLLGKQKYVIPAVLSLALLQGIHYFTFPDFFSNPGPEVAEVAINKELARNPLSTIGFVNHPMMASLVHGDRKYQLVRVGGNTYAGANPLDLPPEKMPTYMYNFDDEHRAVIEKYYYPITLDMGIQIYRKKDLSFK